MIGKLVKDSAGNQHTVYKQKLTGLAVVLLNGFYIATEYPFANYRKNEADAVHTSMRRDMKAKGLLGTRLTQQQQDKIVMEYMKGLASENARTQIEGLLLEGELPTHIKIGPWAGGQDEPGFGQFEPVPAVEGSYINLAQEWDGAVGLDKFRVGEGSLLGTPMCYPCWVWTQRRILFTVFGQDGMSYWAWLPVTYESGDCYPIGG